MLSLPSYSVTHDYMASTVVVWSTFCSHILLFLSRVSSWMVVLLQPLFLTQSKALVRDQVKLAQWILLVDSLCLVWMVFFSTITGLELLQLLLGHLP